MPDRRNKATGGTGGRIVCEIFRGQREPSKKLTLKMRDVQQYRRGAVVQYNTPATPGAGSCIFLHIWSGPSKGTAGCTAMSAENLDVLLRWLDPASNPRLLVGVAF